LPKVEPATPRPAQRATVPQAHPSPAPHESVPAATGDKGSTRAGSKRAASISSWHRVWLGSWIVIIVAGVGMLYIGVALTLFEMRFQEALARNDGNVSAMMGPGSTLQMAGVPHWFFFGTTGLLSLMALVNAIAFYVLLYKMWGTIQAGPARTTPGKAIGFMLIPLFNVYWLFVAVAGLAKDLNAFAKQRNLKARPAAEGLTMAACIMAILPCVSVADIVLLPLAIGSMAKAAADISKQA
jgi:hypothetical protein